SGKLINEVKTPTKHLEVVRQLVFDNPIVNSSTMFRRLSAESVGGYNNDFLYSQDFALWLELAQSGKLQTISQFLTDIRSVNSSLTSIAARGLSL
ncbi:MAG: hypothetical protein ACKOAQ_08265, partial [Acidimicrobiaceae bacterium]